MQHESIAVDAAISMSENELVAALRREADAAQSEYERLSIHQDHAWRYYEAKPFGNEVTGRSQIVLPDVQETIDYMVPSVLRTFISGDRVVEFEATDEESEEGADEATKAIGFNFMRQQDGYRVLHDWLASGLVERYGVVKTMMTIEETVVRNTYQINDPIELAQIDGEIEHVEDNGDGSLTCRVKQTKKLKRFVDIPVPSYEYRFSPRARHEDEADYQAQVSLKTRSQLVEMGFDREQVYALPNSNTPFDEQERQGYHWNDPESTPALELIELHEEYARIDLDGDGIAERVQVYRVENDILRWAPSPDAEPAFDTDGKEVAPLGELAIDTVEEQPFVVFTPFPRPHRLVGYGLADKVMDIQLLSSTIGRQLIDGMYNANLPRPVVADLAKNENTIADLLSPVAGAPIRVKDASGIVPYATTFDVSKSLSVLEWVRGERESRTGITRLNQGLDADALNKTATGTAMMQAQGQQQEEFIARNLAEPFGRLMSKKYRLMKREADPFRVKVDGEYKMVDPSRWPDEINVIIRVGLGSGSKDKRIQYRMALAPIMAEGQQSGQVSQKNVFKMFDGLVRDMGLGQGDDYWIDPDSPEGQQAAQQQGQQQPDPAMIKVMNDQQHDAALLQMKQSQGAAELQLKAYDIQAKHENAADAAQLKAVTDKYRADTEAHLDVYKTNVQAQVALHSSRTKADAMKSNRAGGRLDA